VEGPELRCGKAWTGCFGLDIIYVAKAWSAYSMLMRVEALSSPAGWDILHLYGCKLATLKLCVGTAGLREGSRHCVDSQGASVPCCEWSPSPWARSYMSITSLVLLWTVSTVDMECVPLEHKVVCSEVRPLRHGRLMKLRSD